MTDPGGGVRLSGQWSCSAPGSRGGGGTVPIVPPRRMTNDDVSGTPELSGGDLSRSPLKFRRCGSRRPWLGTLQEKLSGGTVSDDDTGSPYGRGALPFSGVAGRSLPVDVTVAPVLPVEGPQSVPLQVAVVRVDGTMAGDTSGRKCPRDERDWRPPTGVSVKNGGAGSLSGGGRRWPPRMLLEVSFRLCLLGDPPWLVL